MNDDELFERLAAHTGSAEVDPAFDDRLYGLLQRDLGRSRRTRPVLLLAAALLLALAAGSAALIGSGIVRPPVWFSSPRLAYALDGDIYLADLDGANPVLVSGRAAGDGDPGTCGAAGGGSPHWAPDGRHFAFRSGPGECVVIADAAGQIVASLPGIGWDVSWSPDSTRLATWVEFTQTIGIYGIDGQRQALLTVPTCGSGDHDPVWSADGASVVVESWHCEMPIDGSTPTWLPAGDPRARYHFMYSPDGTRIAYVDPAQGFRKLVIAEADGTVVRVVHDEALNDWWVNWYDNPVWSPSGDRVLFSWTPLVDNGGVFEAVPHTVSELRLVDIGTGQVTKLAAETGITPIGFSADGFRILYSTRDEAEGPDGPVIVDPALWSMATDGSDRQLLVSGTTSGEWQPVAGSN